MEKNKIKAITIYGQSNLIENCLTQTCKNFYLKTFPYSAFTTTAITARASIAVVDVKNQIVFEGIIKPILRLHALYPLIILVPDNLMPIQASSTDSVAILSKPLKYQILLKIIASYATNFIYKISHNIFLNTKTLSVIRITEANKNEAIELTYLEYKILKYLLEARDNNKTATEKEILANVFGYHALSNSNTLKTHIHRLKQKLDIDSVIINRRNDTYALCSAKAPNSA